MKNFGFIRCASTSFAGKIADCKFNLEQIKNIISKSKSEGVNILLFPQLSLSSASCGSLFKNTTLLNECKNTLLALTKSTEKDDIIFSVGLPFALNSKIYTVMAVIHLGKILGLVPVKNDNTQIKFTNWDDSIIEDISHTLEIEYAIPFGNLTFTEKNMQFKLRFTESSYNSDIILFPIAEPTYASTQIDKINFYKIFSEHHNTAVIVSNSGIGESSAENIFAGETAIFSLGQTLCQNSFLDNAKENLNKLFDDFIISISDIDIEMILAHKQNSQINSKKIKAIYFTFNESSLNCQNNFKFPISKNPFLPQNENPNQIYENIIYLQAIALAKRIKHISCNKVLIGISGGIDSTFALLVSTVAFRILRIDSTNIHAITMPCFGTTNRTKSNAEKLAKNLSCSFKEINIKNTVLSHFVDIDQDKNKTDVAFENAQARERTQVLLDMGNKIGGLVVGGSDLSEIALGWSTFGGDHISMYNLNSSLTKTVLRETLNYCKTHSELFNPMDKEEFQNIIFDILNTPISPELLPPENNNISQKTESILGPYELHDFFLYHTVVNSFSPDKICFLAEKVFTAQDGYNKNSIANAAKVFFTRFFQSQFKRSTSPEGVAVLPLSLSPRGSWNVPSDVTGNIWTNLL